MAQSFVAGAGLAFRHQKIPVCATKKNKSLGGMAFCPATLFGRDKSTVSRHIKNIFEEGELQAPSVVANYATTVAGQNQYPLWDR